MKHPLWLAALVALLLNAGCALLPWSKKGDDADDPEADLNATEQLLYRNAQRSLRSGNYRQAITELERLEARFPFGRYAEQAQLEIIYAHYMSFSPDAARSAADRFIRLHPQHANVDYAYYLKGLAAYDRNRGIFDRLVTTDVSRRDMTSNHEAYADFATLLARFPGSAYAADARQRMLYLRNVLARSELNIANFYMERGAYIAAANRARYIVENYSRADAVPDALAVLIEANWRLGMEDAANDALTVLATNFPNYPAFDTNGDLVLAEQVRNRDRSWTNMVTLGLLDRPDVPPPIRLRRSAAALSP
ncbi:MAG: outer membrane protein assembly factor BamD [Pseudomonadales bacterium]|nr:outer membrane protein assembly factor BamD [Pseudomonadales bacterium]